jgi:hypothetical protein
MWQLEYGDGTLIDVPWEGLPLGTPQRREASPVVFPRGESLVVAPLRHGLAVDGQRVVGVTPLVDGSTLTLSSGQVRVRRSAAARTRTRETPMARLPLEARVAPRVFANAESMNAALRERFKPRVRDLGQAGQLAISSGWSGVSLDVAKVKVWELETMTVILEGRRVFMFDPKNQSVFSTNGLREQLMRAVKWAPAPPSPDAMLDFIEVVTHQPADDQAFFLGGEDDEWRCVWNESVLDRARGGHVFSANHSVDPWPLDAVRAWHPPRIVDGCAEAFVYEVQSGDAFTVRVDPRGPVDLRPQPRVTAAVFWRHG